MEFKTVSIIGLGYIGLPTAAIFASRGMQVIGVDKSKHVVNTVNKGAIHIAEPGLEQLVKQVVNQNRLVASEAPNISDAFIIAVPTPFKNVESPIPEPDLSYVEAACESIAPVLRAGNLIVLESTSPVGTTQAICNHLAKLRPDLIFPNTHEKTPNIFVAYCPERVLPGNILHELVANDRIIGGITSNCSKAARELYTVIIEGDCHITDSKTAEMAKLTENASRDVQIAFANELSLICDEIGVDVWKLIELANQHPRVNILQPGPGVGGHCIAVDPWFIVSKSPSTSKIIQTARDVNDSKPSWVVDKVAAALAKLLHDNPLLKLSAVKIACYGVTFKADVDDIRQSPAISILLSIAELIEQPIMIVDPNITQLPTEINCHRLTELGRAQMAADIHVLLVDHHEFKRQKPNSGIIVDTRGIWTSSMV